MTQAFSNQAIRVMTPVFYDAAYKVKVARDGLTDASSGMAVIEVQGWSVRPASSPGSLLLLHLTPYHGQDEPRVA
jgi:hypothetical protein